MSEEGLLELRNKLDNIDNTVLDLINERMHIVHQVGALKAKSGGAIYRPEREKAIIDRLELINNEKVGLLNRSAIEALFLEIFAISRNIELPENIAYLGPEGSFTHQAAEGRFGAMSSYISVSSIKGIFREVDTKKVKFGVIPIENSSNGIVTDTITCLSDYNLKIIAEVVLDIHHTLATTCDKIKDIKRIYSKDIAFDQCSIFLENYHLNEVKYEYVDSTTKAAQLASQTPNSAAICSKLASKTNDIPILFENIEDNKDNKTRFLVISKEDTQKSLNDKTSIIVQLPNKYGSLIDFLNDFKEARVNLNKIKSHIVKGISTFFIEFEGHKNDKNIKKILTKHSKHIKVLGSYKKEVEDI